MPIPQAARGDTYFGTPFPGPVPAAAQKLIDAAMQQSTPFQADTSAAMQVGTPATLLPAQIQTSLSGEIFSRISKVSNATALATVQKEDERV